MAVTGTVGQRIAALAAAGLIAAGVATNQPNEYTEPAARAGEVTALRTENSYTVHMPDGRMRAEVHAGAIHWEDKGAWKQPDLQVKARPWLTGLFSAYEAEVTAGPWTAKIDQANPANYRMETPDGAWLAFDMVTKGVSADLETEEWGVKEFITIERGGPDVLTWAVTGSAAPVWDGAVLTVPGLTTRAIVAWDADRKPVGVRAEYEKGMLTAVVDTAGVKWPVVVDPSTMITAGPQEANSRIILSNATYLTARNLSTATTVDATGRVGQITGYTIYRLPAKFAIPALTTANLCTLYVYGNGDGSTTNFNVNVYGARAYRPVIDTGDADAFHGWAASGAYGGTILNDTWSTASYSAGWNAIPLNAAGRDSVKASAGDTLAVMLLSSLDVAATAPTNDGYILISGMGEASNRPKLGLWYDIVPPTSPGTVTVTPISATSTQIAWTGDTSDADSVRVISLTGTTPDSTVIGYVAKAGSPATFAIPSGTAYYRLTLQAVSILDQATNATNWDDHWWYNVTYARDLPLYSYKTHKADKDATYNNVRTTTDQGYITSTAADTLGQWKDANNDYHIYRQSFYAPMPHSNLVGAASIVFTGAADGSTTDFTITAVKGLWNGGNTDDYRYVWAAMDTTKRYGTLTTAGFNAAGADSIVFDAAGRAAIVTESQDTLFVSLLSNLDIAGTAPTGAEYVKVNPAGAVLRVTWALNDSVPTDIACSPIDPDSLLVTWRDRCLDETGYAVVDSLTGVTLATVAANVQTARIGGLLHNTAYRPRIKVLGGTLADQFSVATAAVYTDANDPTNGPTLTATLAGKIVVVIDTTGAGNPGATGIALRFVTSAGDTLWAVAIADTLRTGLTVADSWGFQTYAGWGGAAGDTVTVEAGRTYTVSAVPRSGP